MPELHLHLNNKLGRPSEPVAIKTNLDWVIFGGGAGGGGDKFRRTL